MNQQESSEEAIEFKIKIRKIFHNIPHENGTKKNLNKQTVSNTHSSIQQRSFNSEAYFHDISTLNSNRENFTVKDELYEKMKKKISEYFDRYSCPNEENLLYEFYHVCECKKTMKYLKHGQELITCPHCEDNLPVGIKLDRNGRINIAELLNFFRRTKVDRIIEYLRKNYDQFIKENNIEINKDLAFLIDEDGEKIIIAKKPNEETLGEFYGLLWTHKIHLVCEIGHGYWRGEYDKIFESHSVKAAGNFEGKPNFINGCHRLELMNIQNNEKKDFRMLFEDYKMENTEKKRTYAAYDLRTLYNYYEIVKVMPKDEKVLIICDDGGSESALFYYACVAFKTFRKTQSIDMKAILRKIKRNVPRSFPTPYEYLLCFLITLDVAERFGWISFK